MKNSLETMRAIIVDHPGSPDQMRIGEVAAAIPETFFTAFQAIVWYGQLRRGETVLIHAGAIGVGTAAIQLAKAIGAQVVITAGSDEKIKFCQELGADLGVNYKTTDFLPQVQEFNRGHGADVIVTFPGAARGRFPPIFFVGKIQ